MTKINEKINHSNWALKAGLFIILALPVLVWPPYFFPVDWGKSIVFRSILAIMVFLFLKQIIYKKNDLPLPEVNKNKTVWILRALLIIYLLASIFSVDPLFSFWGNPYRSGGFITFAFYFVFTALAFVMLKKDDWKKSWIFSIFIGLLASFVAIIQYYGLFNRIFMAVPSRPPSTMGNPDILAIYLLLLSFLTLSFAIKEKQKSLKTFYVSSLAIFLFTLLITGSRAAYFGLLIGLVYFIFSYPRRIKTTKIAFAGLLILAAGVIFYVNTTNQYPKFLENNKIFQSISTRLSIKAILEDPRSAVWQVGLSAIKEKPLLGYGPENFSVGFDKYYNPSIPNMEKDTEWFDRAHNIIIQTVSDAGIIGLIAYLALFIVLFWQLQKIKSDDENKIIALGIQATLIGYLIANLFSFDTFSTYLIFFLLIAYSMHLICKKPQESDVQNKIQKDIPYKSVIVFVLFFILIVFLWQYNLVPLQINAEINKASILVDQKQCDKALSVMDKVLPEHSFLDSYVRLEYVEFERTCSGVNPENNLSYTKKGVSLLNEAIKIQPLYTRYWLFLGDLTTTLAEQATNISEKNDLTNQANSYFDKALQLAPKHQEVLTGKAKAEIDNGNYVNAKNYSEKCVLANSTFGGCYWYLGLSEIYLKDSLNADKNMQIAKSNGYDVNSEISLIELGNAYNFSADYKNLATVFENLISANPNVVQYHSSLAFIYAKLGKYAEAKQEALKVLQLSPASKQNVDAFLNTLP